MNLLRAVFLWWIGQLRDVFGAGTVGDDRHSRLPDALVAMPEADAIMLSPRRAGRIAAAQRFPLTPAGAEALRRAAITREAGWPDMVALAAPAVALLERDVVLPLAAEPSLHNALRYALNTLTPFAPEDVAWGWRLLARDRIGGKLRLRLSLTPRTALQPGLNFLQQAGLMPTLVELPAPDGGTRRLWLHDHRHSAVANWRMPALSAVLALVAMLLPFLLQGWALARTGAEMAALQPQVAEALALRRHRARGSAGMEAVARERAEAGDPLRIIAALTEALPDDCWLQELTLQNRKIGLTGQAANGAAPLIARIAAQPGLRAPAFSAPVTRAANGAADQFSIQAEAVP